MRERSVRVAGGAMLAIWVVLTSGDVGLVLKSTPHLVALLVMALVFGGLMTVPVIGNTLERALRAPPRRVFVWGTALVAAAVSLWVAQVVMNGQVIALDSSVYAMEARALSHLSFGAPLPEPRLPFGARFLFEGPDGRLYGVFPPGYPLFLVPFMLIGKPLLAGPVTAAMLILAQDRLARAITRDETAIRLSLLMSLPSFARALETADLLSHAFVGVLAATAVAMAFELRVKPTLGRAAMLGVAVGWTFSARMLDGIVLFVVAFGVIAVAMVGRRISARLVAVAALSALPFVALLAAQQKAATGHFTTPTQSEYFVRSDYPPTCHRLGFGKDVGCSVEHPGDRTMHGDDGYGLDDAFRVVRQRTSGLGQDLFGFEPLAILAFVAVLFRPSPAYATAAAFPLLMTLAYGLFYYGNAPGFGARHLFPAAPFMYVLVARALTATPRFARLGYERFRSRSAALAFVMLVVSLVQADRWRRTMHEVRASQAYRGDLRERLDRARITRGIIATPDTYGYIAALDPAADAPSRHLVVDDRSGLVELRRANPTLPAYFAGPLAIEGRDLPPVAPGLLVEMESAWPSFQRVSKLGARRLNVLRELNLPASGGEGLVIFVAEPGATLTVPFDVIEGGRMTLRMDGFATPNSGDWSIAIDGEPMPVWHGFAPRSEPRRGVPSEPRVLAKGRHELIATCLGKPNESRGVLAAFEALIGEPAPLLVLRQHVEPDERRLVARQVRREPGAEVDGPFDEAALEESTVRPERDAVADLGVRSAERAAPRLVELAVVAREEHVLPAERREREAAESSGLAHPAADGDVAERVGGDRERLLIAAVGEAFAQQEHASGRAEAHQERVVAAAPR